MMWTVDYAESARQDLRDILGYISDILHSPVVAANQTIRIMDAADSLNNMPLRYRLFDKEPWRSRGFRIMPVDNYVVIYLPNEINNTVTIIRIMYGGRHIEKIFNGTDEQT